MRVCRRAPVRTTTTRPRAMYVTSRSKQPRPLPRAGGRAGGGRAGRAVAPAGGHAVAAPVAARVNAVEAWHQEGLRLIARETDDRVRTLLRSNLAALVEAPPVATPPRRVARRRGETPRPGAGDHQHQRRQPPRPSPPPPPPSRE